MEKYVVKHLLLLLTSLLDITSSANQITVYGDVYKDTDFFTRTFPWVIDNIGGDLVVEYYLLGSGRYSVPQMCALHEMKLNAFLQAQYLRCEAEGHPSEMCLCDSGIDPQTFKKCVFTRGFLASAAVSKYTELSIDARPVVELGPWKSRNTVFEVEDSWYLKKICTIFGKDLPRGCVRPSNTTQVLSRRRGVSHFSCERVSCLEYQDAKEYSLTSTTDDPKTTYKRRRRRTREPEY